MEKGVIESQYLFILHQKLSENFYSHNVTEALKRDHHFLFYRGGNRPQENKVNKKSTAKTILEPKSPDLENQGTVRAGQDLKLSPTPSVFTEEQSEVCIERETDHLPHLLMFTGKGSVTG